MCNFTMREVENMNSFKTLKEVCAMLNISRRVIQEYEKNGLIKAVARNKYGHLLYDGSTVSRIAGIRYCQKLGFTLKEIRELIRMPAQETCRYLEGKISLLETKRHELNCLTEKTRNVIGIIIEKNTDLLDAIDQVIKED